MCREHRLRAGRRGEGEQKAKLGGTNGTGESAGDAQRAVVTWGLSAEQWQMVEGGTACCGGYDIHNQY